MGSRVRAICVLACVAALGTANAQRAVPATGHDATGSGGSLSYSVGQADYTTPGSSGGTVAQGVQQPYEYLVLSANEPIGVAFTTTLLPNPTTAGVVLQLSGTPTTDLQYDLFDATGKLLRTGRISGTATPIPMEGFGSATYLLHVVQGGRPITITRIVKH